EGAVHAGRPYGKAILDSGNFPPPPGRPLPKREPKRKNLDDQDPRAVDAVTLEREQGPIRLLERKGTRLGTNRNGRRLAQQLFAVLSGVGLDAGQPLLMEKVLFVGHRGDSRRVDPRNGE